MCALGCLCIREKHSALMQQQLQILYKINQAGNNPLGKDKLMKKIMKYCQETTSNLTSKLTK